jgi:DNA-binding transcriptional regulator YdaS (Cro superfamily)
MHARQKRLLQDAVKLMGRKHVAQSLAVSDATLEAWLKGEQPVPPSKLSALARAADDFAKRIKRD